MKTKRVLLCERDFDGHRKKYCECLLSINEIEFFLYAPRNIGVDSDHFFNCNNLTDEKSIIQYIKWIISIRRIIKNCKIDVVHFLDGDSIMRYFGAGFALLNVNRLVITYHHFFSGRIRTISYYCMLRGKRKGVVHTDTLKKCFYQSNIYNITVCTYPAFEYDKLSEIQTSSAKHYWRINPNVPTIGIVGGLSAYKNIIPFLNAINNISADFQVLICGNPSNISKEEIENAIKPYRTRVRMCLKKLSDDEYLCAIQASDIVFCIYNYSFDGASGPLTDGVAAEKLILSCEHGSLGTIVKRYHLGYSAVCDDINDITLKTEKAIDDCANWYYDETAKKYKNSLSVYEFQKKYREVYYETN